MNNKERGAFILLSLLFGSSFFWMKLATHEMPPWTIAASRLLLGSIGLGVIVLVTRPSMPRDRKTFIKLSMLGITNYALPFWLMSLGEQTVDSSMAAVLQSTMPFFTALMAHFFIRGERLNRRRIVGLSVGFAGIVALVAPTMRTDNFATGARGQLALIGMAASYAVSSIFASRTVTHVPPTVKSFVSMVSATGAAFLAAFVWESPLHLPAHVITWTAIGFLGFVCSCFGFLLYFWLLQAIGPSRTMLFSYSETLIGVLLGALLLGERVSWNLGVGSILIVLGIAVFRK